MRRLIPAFFALLVLAGCEQVPPLTIEQRARFISELLEADPGCDALRKRLASPTLDQAEIDVIYREAKKAVCLKRDV